MMFLHHPSRVVLFALLLVVVSGCASHAPAPNQNAHVRFYSINNFDQLTELSLIPGLEDPGCHDMPLNLSVHRVAQVGFARCQIFSAESCAEGTALTMRWSGKRSRTDPNKNQPTTEVTEGALWLFDGLREVAVGSWRCDAKD